MREENVALTTSEYYLAIKKENLEAFVSEWKNESNYQSQTSLPLAKGQGRALRGVKEASGSQQRSVGPEAWAGRARVLWALWEEPGRAVWRMPAGPVGAAQHRPAW